MSNARELSELAGSYGTGGFTGMKNRIINGAMMIDQRNAGAAVTGNDGVFGVDRWKMRASQSGKVTLDQNANSVTPPQGYTNYLGITSNSAYSVVSGDYFFLSQVIEGFNTADFGWGSSGAATVTLSFWVRSSLTGTFGACVREGNAGTAQYPFSYTISAADTWEQKTVTISGPTIGTWQTGNLASVEVDFSLGMGSTLSGGGSAWTASNYFAPTGTTSVVGTSGATFYITGVQLEKGSTATSFDYRPYGTELALCQRYLPVFNSGGANPAFVGFVAAQTTGSVFVTVPFVVAPRVPPTGITVSSASHFQVVIGAVGPIPSGITFNQGSLTSGMVNAAVSGVTAGTAGIMYGISTSAQIQFTGCEL